MRIQYFFQPSRWRAFFIYILQSLLLRLDDSKYPAQQHEVEQFMYRYLTCHPCVVAGTCVESDCKCKMPERAHVRTDFCPMTKWGPMKKDKKGWEEFKKRGGLRFLLWSSQKETLEEFLIKTFPEIDLISIKNRI